MASELAGTASKAQGMVSELRGTPSRRRAAAFTANASIARRLAAAQLAIDAVLTDAGLLETLAAYGYGAERMAEGNALRDRALPLQVPTEA